MHKLEEAELNKLESRILCMRDFHIYMHINNSSAHCVTQITSCSCLLAIKPNKIVFANKCIQGYTNLMHTEHFTMKRIHM